MSRKAIAKALEALLAAPTTVEGLQVFTDHGDLLALPEALELIKKNIELTGDDKALAQLLRNRGHLVAEFQRDGLEAVRAAMIEPEDILNAVNGWLNCNNIVDAWNYLDVHQERLVTAQAGEALEHSLTQFADEPNALSRINNCRAMHSIAIADGLVSARRFVGQQVADTLSRSDRAGPPDAIDELHGMLLQLIDKNDESDAWVSAQMNYGFFLRGQKRNKDAAAAFEASLQVLRPATRLGDHFRCHYELGSIATSRDTWDTQRAIEHLSAALAIGSCKGQEPVYLEAFVLLAIAFLENGDHTSAVTQLTTAVKEPREFRSDIWTMGVADIAVQLAQDRTERRQISLDVAIQLFHAVLEQISAENNPEQWASNQQTLAMAYRDIQSIHRAESLDRALHHTNEALTVETKERDPYQWAKLQHNLGTIYFLKTHDDAYGSLLNATRCYEAALGVHTRERYPNDWAMTRSALGACLLRLHDVRGDPGYLDQAVVEARHSLDWWSGDGNAKTPRAQHLKAEANNTLGSALVERSVHTGTEDLRAGIAHLAEADYAYASLGAVERRREVLMNLARSYSALSETDTDAFDQAVDYARRALSTTSRETDAYLWAFFQRNYAALLANSGDPTHLDEALVALGAALDVFKPERFRADYVKTQGFVGQIHFNAKQWGDALAAYRQAIDITDVLLQDNYTEIGRSHQIAETSSYFINAAYCLAKLKRYDESLVMLERGKARALARYLATGAIVSGNVQSNGALASTWREVAEIEQSMRNLLPDSPPDYEATLAARLKSAQQRMTDLLSANNLLVDAALPLSGILATAPNGGVLVAVLVTLHGAMAFIVPHGQTVVSDQHVVQGDVTTSDLHAVLVGTKKRAGLVRLSLRAKYAKSKRDAHEWRLRYARQLRDCCDGLWDALLKPVVQRIEKLGIPDHAPLVFLPQGGLGMLPLHAARNASIASGKPGRWPLLERFNVSYAPNAYALRAARSELKNNRHEQAVSPALLAVLNPTDDLAFADLEGAFVMSVIDNHEQTSRVLRSAQATAARVRESLSNFDYLHFACHGSFNVQHPERSALHLAAGTALELSELTGPDINLSRCRLVALSACETGMIEFQQSPDEYVGLPAALLKAGAPAVLGTLWEVDDLASAIVVGEFYRQHLVNNHSPAKALCLAQRWLSAARHDELAQWLMQRLDALQTADSAAEIGQVCATIEDIRKKLARGDLGQVPFSNPWYWAAFTLTGV